MTPRLRSSRASSSRCRRSTGDRLRRDVHARHVPQPLARHNLGAGPDIDARLAGILATRAPSAERAAVKLWPALPAPGELVRLPLPCPPQLIELSGYTGGARLVALWWSPVGDELMISDGTLTETGRWRGWLCFSGHPLARLFLEPYRLGDSEDENEHQLLVDRYLGTLDVGLSRDVEQLLATQPSELHALTADLSAGETEALLQRLLDVHDERERAKSPQQFHADLRAVWQQEHELVDQLTALLDDAQRALCEALPPLPGVDAGRGDG